MKKIIAIDGPASVGKSSLAKLMAKKYNCPLLHSGQLYRTIAYNLIFKKIDLSNREQVINCIKNIDYSKIRSRDIYSNKIDRVSSEISSKRFIREELKKYQRSCIKKSLRKNKYAIVEGRDIGTVVFPEAEFKIFLWANSNVRAKRRLKQLSEKGEKTSFKKILSEINSRDLRDLNRKIAPLKPDVNSVLLDTSYLDIEQSFNAAVEIIKN